MYLEQELESLKAVLEIKNEKLHQQDVKLMKMEKLVSFIQSLTERGNTWGLWTRSVGLPSWLEMFGNTGKEKEVTFSLLC